MFLSDISIRRPVFASVISLVLIVFGLVSFDRLPLREYPDTEAPVVSISTDYRGASSAVVETRITQVIEDQISGIEGIKNISSSSSDGRSQINVEFDLGRNIEDAANDIRDRVSRILRRLPEEADPPQVQKSQSDSQPSLWVSLSSNRLSEMELGEFAQQHIIDRLSTVPGVAYVRVNGLKKYSMRVWLDRKELAARSLTINDIENALRAENVELPAGSVRSTERDFTVRLLRGYSTEQDFRQLVIARGNDGYLVRLGDVARVELAPEENRSTFRGNRNAQLGLGVVKQSTANTLEMARAVKEEAKVINETLPDGVFLEVSNDTTVFVENAVSEVYKTLFIASGLVVLVMYLFLGDFRAMLVPAVTLPVSLIATFIVLLALNYSVNLLTLLALVLAIGLVVDDGIVVLENIHRRMRAGESPMVAAYKGSRQVGFAVIVTTLVLIAVFVPITFLQGDIGKLFSEFSVTMAAAVGFSSLVALTLSPVICVLVLKPESEEAKQKAEAHWFSKIQRKYEQLLRAALDKPYFIYALFMGVLVLIAFLYVRVPREFTPREDRGMFFVVAQMPQGSSYENTLNYALKIENVLMPLVDAGDVRRILLRVPGNFGGGTDFSEARAIMVLNTWGKRRPVWDIINDVRRRVATIPGVRSFAMAPQALRGGGGQPLQFVIGGSTYEELVQWRDIMLAKMRENPNIIGPDTDYKETKPQLRVVVNKERAAELGVSVSNIGRTLETMLGSRLVTTFMMNGEEHDVILEGIREDNNSTMDMTNIYVRSDRGKLVPLSNLIKVEEFADSASLNRYNRVRSITINANLADGYSLGEALTYMENLVHDNLPPSATIGYKGQSLEYKEAGQSVYFVFILALVVVYLVLAAQFESYVHPLVIMLAVPLAIAGALLGLYFFNQSLNIYSQIGIIMLVGLAAKNGILIVEFANQLRDTGIEFREALVEATVTRLRPIAMTAITTVVGAVPLVIAAGAGSETRFVIGLVIITGVSVATVFTLFVVPVAYQMWAKHTGSPKAAAQRLQRELENEAVPSK